jgi:hypothetical protein
VRSSPDRQPPDAPAGEREERVRHGRCDGRRDIFKDIFAGIRDIVGGRSDSNSLRASNTLARSAWTQPTNMRLAPVVTQRSASSSIGRIRPMSHCTRGRPRR